MVVHSYHDECVHDANAELFPNKEAALRFYEAIIKRFKRENLTVTYKLGSLKTMGYDHSKTEIGNLMLGNAQKIFEEMGIEFKRGRTGLGGHDASVYVKEGVPTLVLSCGMQNIHTTKEWIYVEDLHNCTELIMRLIDKA